jgi:AcrR family transcriptional regulator
MTHDQPDLRVQRTQQLIQEALIELSNERGFNAVTVGEIAQRAKVNRATFYRHYQDKYGLVEEIFQKAIDRMRQDLGPPGEAALNIDPLNPPQRWVRLFEHFEEHKNLYRALLGSNGSSWFTARMRDQISNLIEQREQLRDQIPTVKRQAPETGIPRKAAITLASTLLISTVTWWLENGMQYSPKQIASLFLEIVLNGYIRVLGL